MAKTVSAPATPAYTAVHHAAATAAMVKASVALDKSVASANAAATPWALATAIGLKVSALTIEQVASGIINATPKAHRAATVAAIAAAGGGVIGIDTIRACGDTLKSRYQSLKALYDAGALDRIISGEALNTVARDVRMARKETAKGAAPKANTKGKSAAKGDTVTLPPLPTTAHDMVASLVSLFDGLSPKGITAIEADIALLSAAMGRMNAKLAAAKAAPAAKRTRKATVADFKVAA